MGFIAYKAITSLGQTPYQRKAGRIFDNLSASGRTTFTDEEKAYLLENTKRVAELGGSAYSGQDLGKRLALDIARAIKRGSIGPDRFPNAKGDINEIAQDTLNDALNDALASQFRTRYSPEQESAIRQFIEQNREVIGLQYGGIIPRTKGGQLSLIGEGRHNEAVVPLPNGRAIPIEFPKNYNDKPNVNVTFNINIDQNGEITNTNTISDSSIDIERLKQPMIDLILEQTQPGGVLAS